MIINLHGFNSTGDSDKTAALRRHFNVVSPTLSVEPFEAIKQIQEIMYGSTEKVMVLGTSLGGFYALCTCASYDFAAVLINPSLRPHETLKPRVGMNTNFKTGLVYEFKQEYLEQLEFLYNQFKNSEIYSILLNFYLSKHDELLDHSVIPTLFPYAKTIKFYDDNHRFEKFEEIIPEIKTLYEYYKNMNGEGFGLYLSPDYW